MGEAAVCFYKRRSDLTWLSIIFPLLSHTTNTRAADASTTFNFSFHSRIIIIFLQISFNGNLGAERIPVCHVENQNFIELIIATN